MFSFSSFLTLFFLESASKKQKLDVDKSDVIFVYESIDLLQRAKSANETKTELDSDETASEKSLVISIGGQNFTSTPHASRRFSDTTNIPEVSQSDSVKIRTQNMEVVEVLDSQMEATVPDIIDKLQFMSNLSLREKYVEKLASSNDLMVSVFLQRLPVTLPKRNINVAKNACIKQFLIKEKAWDDENIIKHFGRRFYRKAKNVDTHDEVIEIDDDDEEDWIDTSISNENAGKKKCAMCDEYVSDMKEHLQTHRTEIICEICGKEYHIKGHLVQHILREHKDLPR